jgi:hypothetical protein
VLAVPAARYGEFKDELLALHKAQDNSQPWVAETTWQHGVKAGKTKPTKQAVAYRLVIPSSTPTAVSA